MTNSKKVVTHFVKSTKKFEIDLSNHKTRLLDQHIVDGAELIIVMTKITNFHIDPMRLARRDIENTKSTFQNLRIN